MLFNSFHFLLFLPLVLVLFFNTPHKYRWIILLSASIFFYMYWKAIYILIIVVSASVDYLAGYKMSQIPEKIKRKKWLYLSLISNLAILITFKYFDFFAVNINAVLQSMSIDVGLPVLHLLLPMGISFYTFQTMAYSIDVYSGKAKAELHAGYFGLYVMYFPQLVAGPIERADHLISQFKTKVNFNYERFAWGARQMIWGFFKKVVIADRLAQWVDPVYSSPELFDGSTFILATVFFAFQIYCDFSGYSDIAIGCSRMFGVELMENFRLPYFSSSISQFWSRWHISLSTWFRDYLYIPLGGNRVVKWRWYYNLFIVFLISGFWHGAEWTFIIWGGLHGIFLIIENGWLTKINSIAKIPSPLKIFFIFSLVCFSWIFFRADSIGDAGYIVSHLFSFDLVKFSGYFLSGKAMVFIILVVLFLLFLFSEYYLFSILRDNRKLPSGMNIAIYSFITAIILVFGFFGENQFIYFQF